MQLGTGTAITFASGFCAEVLDVRPPPASRVKVDTSHMLTPEGSRTNLPGLLAEWGEAEIDMGFDPGVTPPINADPESVVITFPDGETWTFTGWLSRYEPGVPLEDKMTCTAAIQASGKPTIVGST